MSNQNSPPPSPSARRSSFSPGQKMSELFGRPSNPAGIGTSAYPNPIATAAANAQAQQRRRMSISSLGLSGSPTQTSAFTNARVRQESVSSGGTGSPSLDESAIEEGDASTGTSPSSPFARRMSYGARALRDVRTGTGNNNGRAPITSIFPHSVKGRDSLSSYPTDTGETMRKASNHSSRRSGEGFNWSEQLRTRAERSSSITAPPTAPGPGSSPREHQRATSLAGVEQPIKEMPKQPRAPDAFQERILKGDFYMD